MTDELIPATKAAELLGIGRDTVIKKLKSGKLPGKLTSGGWCAYASGITVKESPVPAVHTGVLPPIKEAEFDEVVEAEQSKPAEATAEVEAETEPTADDEDLVIQAVEETQPVEPTVIIGDTEHERKQRMASRVKVALGKRDRRSEARGMEEAQRQLAEAAEETRKAEEESDQRAEDQREERKVSEREEWWF